MRRALYLGLLVLVPGCRFTDPEASREPSYTPLWLYPDGNGYLALKNATELYAVDLRDGKKRWSRELTGEATPFGQGRQRLLCPPSFVGRSVMLREEEEWLVLDGETGQEVRRSPAERDSQFGARACPAVAADGTYVQLTESGTRLSRHREDGSELWASELPKGVSAVSAPKIEATYRVVVRAAERVLVYADDGKLESSTPLTAYAQ